MQKVRLGKTGLNVSRVGMGGIPIQRPPEKEAIRVIRHALDLGVNFIDTAHAYGDSEERFGKAIEGSRDQVIIATRTHYTEKIQAKECIETSLKRLRTDHIDIWQFHNVGKERYEKILGPGGAMEAAQVALREGIIEHIGITTHDIEIARKAIRSGQFEMILFPFNFVNNEASDELIFLAREHGVGFTAMKPFAGGRLTDASLAIKYLLQFDDVVPVPGIEKVEEIEEIVRIVNGPHDLTPEEEEKMEKIRAELGTRFCQWCGYCMPSCPQNIYIPGIINAHVGYKLWPPEAWLKNHAEDMEVAKTCIECGTCEEKCPYQLPIREKLLEGIKFYERIVAEHDHRGGG